MAIPNPQVAATSVSDQRLDIDGSTWQLNSITNESVTLYTLAAASGTSYKIGYLAERPATANFTGGNAAPAVAGKTLVVGLTNIDGASKFHVDYDRAFVVFDNSVSSPVNVTYSGMGSIQRAKDINESLLANEWAVKTSGTVTGTSEYSAKKHATDAATSYTNFRNDYLGDYANDSAANGGGATVAVGSLYFNTTTSKLKVCTDASGTPTWANATSAVEGVATITEFSPNGTASHFAFSHDVGLQIVWLNGVRLIQGTDYLSVNSDSSTSNMTSGTASHIYFASVPQSGDVLSAMGFGTVTSTAVVPVSGGTFTGNVGIGTASITDSLTVKTTNAQTRISLESSAGKWAIGAEDGDKFGILNYGTSTPFTIDSAGVVTLSGDFVPATPLSHRNIIINGDFRINQAGNKTGKTSHEKQMAGDRWSFDTNIGTWSGGTENDAPTGSGFVSSGYFNCTVQGTTGSSGYTIVTTRFEGQDLQHIRKGTSNAKPVTLSFWVKSPTTGTHICELYDGDNTRHCSQSYTISSANTWEYKSVTFPADTSGAFDNDNGLSLYVQWWLGAGTSYTSGTLQTTWGNNTAANRAVGQVNVGGTAHSSNNYFQLTGVQLELGSVATPFEHRSFADELRRCLRYFERSYAVGTATGTTTEKGAVLSGGAAGSDTTGYISAHVGFKVEKRADPTMTFYDTNGNVNKVASTTRGVSTNYNQTVVTNLLGPTGTAVERSSGSSNSNIHFHYIASAEF